MIENSMPTADAEKLQADRLALADAKMAEDIEKIYRQRDENIARLSGQTVEAVRADRLKRMAQGETFTLIPSSWREEADRSALAGDVKVDPWYLGGSAPPVRDPEADRLAQERLVALRAENERTGFATALRRADQYDRFIALSRELFLRKNSEYGDAIADCGVLGAVAEITGIAGRLKNVMMTNAITTAEEVIKAAQADPSPLLSKYERDGILRDKFIDSINYGVIGLMMMEDGNYTGK